MRRAIQSKKSRKSSSQKKAVVLLSAGLDSTINLAAAEKELEVKLVLTFDYGQKAALSEIRQAKKICTFYKLKHQVIPINWMKAFSSSSLINPNLTIPTNTVRIESLRHSQKTAQSVWVPNRNGIFLNIAAGFAESLKADFVVPGFNKEEAATFPDNSYDFMEALDHSFKYSTSNHVKVKCYTQSLNKTEIVKFGRELDAPLSLIWPCYFNLKSWCGKCESCRRSLRAFKEAGVEFHEN